MIGMKLKPSYSKSQIDRAGHTLREWWAAGLPEDEYGTATEIDAALDVIWDFRACFAEPLRKTIMGLRYMVEAEGGSIGGDREVTQRLKRLPAILSKLDRRRSMRMSQMQDIGGCRAVLPGGADEVRRVALRFQRRWRVVTIDDRARDPHPITGYRAVHVIVERDERLIEIQLRTVAQQQWAEQVERAQRILGEDLKDGEGPPEVLRYYRLLSDVIAIGEAGQPIDDDRRRELDELEDHVHQLMDAHRGA